MYRKIALLLIASGLVAIPLNSGAAPTSDFVECAAHIPGMMLGEWDTTTQFRSSNVDLFAPVAFVNSRYRIIRSNRGIETFAVDGSGTEYLSSVRKFWDGDELVTEDRVTEAYQKNGDRTAAIETTTVDCEGPDSRGAITFSTRSILSPAEGSVVEMRAKTQLSQEGWLTIYFRETMSESQTHSQWLRSFVATKKRE